MPTNKDKIIYYRTVVNDAVCHPWESMPEVQPATLTGLINYLREVCNISPEPLNIAATWSNDIILSYGMRKQFSLPVAPTEDELSLLEKWNELKTNESCPVCSSILEPSYFITSGANEMNHTLSCKECGVTFSLMREVAWTSSQISSQLKSAKEKKR